MEWYWITLICIGAAIGYGLLLFPLWAILRLSSIQSRYEELQQLEQKENED